MTVTIDRRNNAVMLYPRIDSIIIENRVREEYGDLEELAELIREHGVLEPILISTDRYLAAGERRILAAKMAGLEFIPAIDLGPLTTAQRRLIELAENAGRKDFTQTEIEKSRSVVALATAAAEVIAEEVQSLPAAPETDEETRFNEKQVSGKRGPDAKPDSLRQVAARIGMSPSQITKARQHVAAVEAHPQLKDEPQATAIDYAKAVKEEPVLAGSPVPAVVDFARAQRKAMRREREQEQKQEDKVLAASPAAMEARERELLINDFHRYITAGRSLIGLNVDALAAAFSDANTLQMKMFIKDVRPWLDRMDRALAPGVHAVGGG